MRRHAFIVMGVVVASACGDNREEGVVFKASGRPALVAARIDDAPFEILTAEDSQDTDWSYRIPSFHVIDIIVACGSRPTSMELRTTAATDFDRFQALNCGAAEPPSEDLTVTVHDGPGNGYEYLSVSDAHDQSLATDLSSTLLAYKPLADAIAYDDTRFAIARDIDMSHGPTDVDLDIFGGNILQPGTFTVDAVDQDERLLSLTLLSTKNGTVADWVHPAGTYISFPSGVIVGDFRNTSIFASSATNELLNTQKSRSLSRYTLDDAPESFPSLWTWMPHLPDLALSGSKTSATLPIISFPYTSTSLVCSSSDVRSEQIVETAEWEALRNPAAVEFDESSPGWNPDWAVASTGRHCEFYVDDDSPDGGSTTEYEWLAATQ